MIRGKIKNAKRIVIKVGSSLVTNNGLGLHHERILHWVEQIVCLHDEGKQVVLVSSGAVAEGVSRLGLKTRPVEMHLQQASAAVGQMGLVQIYESFFKNHDVQTAQILLSHEDLSDRTRYLNARTTLTTLLEMGVIQVVNENDTVATAELCLGGNDTLAGLVANLISAEAMIVLTDQDGVYEEDPRLNTSSTLIPEASANDDLLLQVAGEGASLGRGGMLTKISAAKLAARSGTDTVIANGKISDVLIKFSAGELIGSLLYADSEPMAARKQWLAGQLVVKGTLQLDPGAIKVLKNSGTSLLAVGVEIVEGQFSRGDVVSCVDSGGNEIARGLVNYDSKEVDTIRGKASEKIVGLLGYSGDEEVIHRDNLVLVLKIYSTQSFRKLCAFLNSYDCKAFMEEFNRLL